MRTFVLGLSLATVATACGDDGVHHLADAPPGSHDDAPPGDAPPDGPPQPVTLTITLDGAPVAGITVYFQNPDSTEVATKTTDAAGVASSVMALGGYVTAVDPFPAPPQTAVGVNENHALRTFAGVKAGDHLVLDAGSADQGQPITLTLPTDAASTNGYYDVFTDCGRNELEIYAPLGGGSGLKRAAVGNPTQDTTLYGCGATANFLVVTLDDSYDALNYFEVANVPIAGGTPTTPLAVNLSGNTWSGTARITTNATHIPDGYVDSSLSMNFVTAGGELGTGDYGDTDNYQTVAANAATFGVPLPAPTGAVRVDRLRLNDNNFNQQDLYRWGATAEVDGSFAFDVSGLPLLGFADAPTYDQATNTISWTSQPGAAPDAYLLEYEGERDFTDGSGTPLGQSYWTWEIAGPASGASIVLPTLIGDAADFNTLPTDNTSWDPINGITLAKLPGGYDLVRAHAFALIDSLDDLTGHAITATGHFELDSYGYLGGGRGKLAKRAQRGVTSPLQVARQIRRILRQARR